MKLLVGILACFMLVVGVSASSTTLLPCEFYGKVTLNGVPAPPGTLITGQVDGERVGLLVTEDQGSYGGSSDWAPKLAVESTRPTGRIVFTVGGIVADQTTAFSQGTATRLDLSAHAGNKTIPQASFIDNLYFGNETDPAKWDEKKHQYPYHYGNLSGTVNFSTSREMYAKFVLAQSANPQVKLENLLTQDPYQDYLLAALIQEIRNKSDSSGDQARIAISLVQNIGMDYGRSNLTRIEYPYQALHTEKTISYDNAILGAYILSKLGYNTSVISVYLPKEGIAHAMTGIATKEPTFQGTGYSVLTRGFIPTTCGMFNAPNFTVVQVSPGARLDMSKEYLDGLLLRELLPTPKTTKENDARWQELIDYYGL